MQLSIIIPTHNEAANISSLLHFLFENTDATSTEIIIADGNSSDNTVTIAQAAGAKAWVSPKRGRAAQMNYGAAMARGNVLYFVHADSRPPVGFEQDISAAIANHYWAGCYRFRFDSNRFLLKINSYFTRFDSLTVRGGDQTLFITKSFFEQLKGFDESYVIMEDYDIIERIWSFGKQYFKLIPKDVLVSARKYETNSWLRVQVANLVAMLSYRLKVSPAKIAARYKQMLNYR
jgi:rSAM/selenodomain-associated transferase 2